MVGYGRRTRNIFRLSGSRWRKVQSRKEGLRQLQFSYSENRNRQRDQRNKSLCRSELVHLGSLPIIKGHFKGLKRVTFLSSQTFPLIQATRKGLVLFFFFFFSPSFQFEYPSCHTHHVIAGSQVEFLPGLTETVL